MLFIWLRFLAFNWKEKLRLGIQEKGKRESISLDLTGRYKELKDRLDLNNGDVDIDFTKDQQTYQKAQSHLSSVNHNIPILKIGDLFGSKKTSGMLPEKPAKKNFRHKRIFGVRGKHQTASEWTEAKKFRHNQQ